MIGVSGHSLTEDEKKFIVENDIGGVTLFGRNVQSPEQVFHLCEEIHALGSQLKSKLPPLIAVDQEGGRVARLRAPLTVWPPLAKLGDKKSLSLSRRFAKAMGSEIRALGMNVNWAPSADVFTNPLNKVIGDRALSSQAEVCAELIPALLAGYEDAEILACVKHFPGHGNTLIDSHEELPIEDSDLSRLKKVELLPFVAAIKALTPMVMTSHILFKHIDAKNPVTFSEFFLQKILREELGFDGVIVSDDLGMKALAKYHSVADIPLQSFKAGVNILLYCNEPDSPPAALESVRSKLSESTELSRDLNLKVESSLQKIRKMKQTHASLQRQFTWSEAQSVIGAPEHQKLAQDILS
jgi:beta-N-acetylhexosaminidase